MSILTAAPGLLTRREEFLARVIERLGTHPSDFQETIQQIATAQKTALFRRAAGVLLPLVFRESSPESLDKFYQLSTKIIQEERSYKKALKENKDEARAIREKYPDLVYAKMATRARKRISQYTHMIDIVVNSDMPEEQKREKIRAIEMKRLQIAKQTLEAMKRKPYTQRIIWDEEKEED